VGKPGRKPKPLKKQIAEGDPRHHGIHKLGERLANTPQPSKGLPDCPEYLTGASRYAYNVWKEELELMDMDRRPDAQMLEAAAIAYGVMRDALEARNWRLTDKYLKTLRSLTNEFGFTPVSREGLNIEKPDGGEGELAEILAGPYKRKPIQ